MNRILVTGGAGFVGSFLCDALISRGASVVCLDNFHTGCHENIAHLLGHPRFRLVSGDVERPLDWLGQIDCIYHLACPASPRHYQADPVRTMRTCVLGAINALDLARRHGARILLASTSEIYGNPLCHPQREDYLGNVNCFGPRACYDEGKRAAETLFHDYHRMYGVDIRVARIFNTYGPRMAEDDGRVVSNFIVQALRGQPITIYGDGLQTRCFCFATDLAEGLVRLMMHPGELPQPVNLGNPAEFTMRELAQKIIRIVGRDAIIDFHDLPQDDPTRRRPDITLAQETLGWQPQVALEDGLTRTAAYFSAALAAQELHLPIAV
ncbi:UDP-glucuronic acid decarboxylase family protein [Rhodobacter ferrooxidans]|uniref:NAD-dependent epimerase/dehydratase n=1 Tax=Rhodobacter ferrooxidans TaxID=371731 RepID=C8S492_9RHOB|nr:UDP-glucuronic acid decarboxylase family protein [Rhodobacter sp. SW2]EEW24151.1 NAD-dependent epimerase/dehydratase [Rhodobacter sp. SW2]